MAGISTDAETNPNIAFFNALGVKYEDAYGRNEGQIKFVRDSLARLEADYATNPSSFSHSSSSDPPRRISVLDIGVGTGRPAAAMAAERGMAVHGFDFAPAMVEQARRNVPAGTFEVAHTLHFATERVFDAAFAMFATFGLRRVEMAGFARRWARWIRPGGYVFIGTFRLEAFDPTTTEWEEEEKEKGEERGRRDGKDDGNVEDHGAMRVRRRFFGQVRSMLVFSDAGWERLLREAGFEIVGTQFAPFQPPADCDWEPHYFITARRIPDTGKHAI